MDYFRPRGDITTVLDLTNRDIQDNYLFPLDTDNSWFHRGENKTVYPTSVSVQEFSHRGPADFGQFFTFEIGSLPAGDLLQSIILQIRLGHWYTPYTNTKLERGEIQADLSSFESAQQYWTWANSLGTSLIEYAEFVVGEQTIERLTGEFIRTFLNIFADINTQFGVSTDGLGNVPGPLLYVSQTNPSASTAINTALSPNRPWSTENGTLFCVLPFFFIRTRLKEVFPLLSCNEGNVRVNIKLRPFNQVVRNFTGFRSSCDQTPLNQEVRFVNTSDPDISNIVQTSNTPPIFQDFRILTVTALTSGTVREAYLHRPFEQIVKLVQTFSFDEPLKYIVNKPNPNSDTIEVQLPLELNHPVTELIWVFRRKAVQINNEWYNFTPVVTAQNDPVKVYPPWLNSATIRINGSEVISADGNFFREHIAKKHKAGIISYSTNIYGYSFAEYPDNHQPSGTVNMSRTNSITINMKVNTPSSLVLPNSSYQWDESVLSGWDIYVFAIHYNWLRFENGICNKMFSD
jgi:hypothetical protein